MSIEFADPDHLAKVLKFAIENNCADKLLQRLNWLSNYGFDGDTLCVIHSDHAPNSFEFVMKHPGGDRWFNGGLIYSGPSQRLDGSAPAFTVSVEPHTNEHKWSVHT